MKNEEYYREKYKNVDPLYTSDICWCPIDEICYKELPDGSTLFYPNKNAREFFKAKTKSRYGDLNKEQIAALKSLQKIYQEELGKLSGLFKTPGPFRELKDGEELPKLEFHLPPRMNKENMREE